MKSRKKIVYGMSKYNFLRIDEAVACLNAIGKSHRKG